MVNTNSCADTARGISVYLLLTLIFQNEYHYHHNYHYNQHWYGNYHPRNDADNTPSLQPPLATGMTGSSVLGRVETAAGERGPCYKIQHFHCDYYNYYIMSKFNYGCTCRYVCIVPVLKQFPSAQYCAQAIYGYIYK